MKKVRLFFIQSLITTFVCCVFYGCEKSSEIIPIYKISQVAKCERDSVKTYMSHNGLGSVSEYNLYISDLFVCKANVNHVPSGIVCSIRGIEYSIKWDATIGGSRAASVTATFENKLHHRVEYFYDSEGRLKMALVEVPGEADLRWIHYVYKESSIVIDDAGLDYEIRLSSEENTGFVCNVLDYSNAFYTSNYVINPDLYFLNIYGKPIEYLPYGQAVSRSNNNIIRVGKYYYEY